MTVRLWPTSVETGPVRTSRIPDNLKSRFLEGLAEPELESILAAATRRSVPANSVLINQGDPADYFFLLTTGCARHFFTTKDGRKVLLLWLAPGEISGGAAFLSPPSSYLVSTETVKDSRVLVWHRNTIRDLAARYPKLMQNALSLASDYFAWFLAAHVALISHSARERLAQVLISLAQGIGRKVPGGLKLDVTNEQLASTANVTPFTASRLLSEWRRNGAVVKSRGSVTLRAPERLFLHAV